MPGRNGTGPMGRGAMTGGSFGDCAEARVRPVGLAGHGWKRGVGGRFANGSPSPYCRWVSNGVFQKEWLEQRRQSLQVEMDLIQQQLANSQDSESQT